MMRAQIAKALNLTPEQQEKLKTLRLDNAKQMARLRADMQIARLDLQALLGQPAPKPAEVKAKAAEVSRVAAEILSKRVDFQMGMKGILTPEQQEKLQTLRQKAKMRMMQDRRGPGMPGGPGGPGVFWKPVPPPAPQPQE